MASSDDQSVRPHSRRKDVGTPPRPTVIVTGAGRGLGREIAIAFARSGAGVVLASRTCRELSEVADAIAAEGSSALPVRTDVSDPESVRHMVQQTLQEFGHIDCLVNNAAGPNYIASVALSDDSRWKAMFEVNVFGVYLCTKAVVPHMIRAKYGRIINISSIAGQAGAAFNSAYAASKAAVIGFTKAVALEVAELGITCNAICPWHVDTALMRDAMAARARMFGRTADEHLAKVVAMNPQRRLITAAEVASLAVYLSSPGARGINGQAINQCGGFLTA